MVNTTNIREVVLSADLNQLGRCCHGDCNYLVISGSLPNDLNTYHLDVCCPLTDPPSHRHHDRSTSCPALHTPTDILIFDKLEEGFHEEQHGDVSVRCFKTLN